VTVSRKIIWVETVVSMITCESQTHFKSVTFKQDILNTGDYAAEQ